MSVTKKESRPTSRLFANALRGDSKLVKLWVLNPRRQVLCFTTVNSEFQFTSIFIEIQYLCV